MSQANSPQPGADARPIAHAVKKGARYLPAFKRLQFGAHIGKWAVKIIRGRSFMTRDEALRCADATITRGAAYGYKSQAPEGAFMHEPSSDTEAKQ